MKEIITVEFKQCGQPKPYADSIYEGIITFSDQNGKPIYRSEDDVKKLAKIVIRNFNEPPKGWADGTLNFCKNLKPSKWGGGSSWHIKVTEAYTD